MNILILGALLVIVLIIYIVLGVKAQSAEGGDDMIKNVYVYLVLFATLMMIIGGSISVFMAVADIVSPTPYYQSYEEYRTMGSKEGVSTQLSEKQLQEKYAAMVLSEKERQISRTKNTLVKSFGWIIIPLPIFFYFKRLLAKKEG
ncbi:MAG: hypothetical protein M0T74_15610 [Desulfitobacterium hafniense]|nr:hypothetical protein [Desulfitobacterium hafniense]